MNTTANLIIKTLTFSIFIVSIISLQGCDNASASIDTEKKAEEVIKVPVEAFKTKRENISDYYAANAILESTQDADVISKVQGLIEAVYVEEGDYVEAGQILAKIDDTRYQLTLEQRKAELAQVQGELSRLNSAKSRALVSADKLEKLEWQYASLNASTKLAELDVKETNVIAPINGYVANRYVKVGNLVQQYQHKNLFSIVSQKKLEGVIYLPEGRFSTVKNGQPVELTVPALNNAIVNAHIERISPIVDASNGTFKAVVAVDNAKGSLKPGMFAEVNIQLGKHENAIVAPSNAILSLDNADYIFKIENNIAVKTKVITGYRFNGLVEIIEGLNEADSIIVAGHNNLKNKSTVTVINQAQ